jgi:hypothetical protein
MPASPLQLGADFLGVLLNPPWSTSVTPAQVASLHLEKVCPLGFIFVWVEKEVLSDVVDVFARVNYVYVENLTWVHRTASNRVRVLSLRVPFSIHVLTRCSLAVIGRPGSIHRPLAPHAAHLPARLSPVRKS